MAVIALSGNTIGCCIGTGSFEGVGTAFSSVKQSVGSLVKGISTLKSKIDTARIAANVDTSHTQAQNVEKREETKQGALTIGYDKLETLISDVSTVDNKSADKIRERKNDFYAKYSYLKPECEKSAKEKRKEFWQGVGDAIGGFFKDAWEWCKENWVAIVTAIGVLIIAVLIVVFTPLTAVFVACIAGIIGLVLLVADIVVACCNDGKGIATLLAENGHPILAQMFTGFQWGCDLVEIILPLGAAIKVMGKVGVKQFFKISWSSMKQTCKETFEAVFKSGFKDGCKNALTICAKSFLFDWDDLKLYNKDMLNFSKDPLKNMVTHFVQDGDKLVPISDKAISVLDEYGLDSLKILENGDLDWDSIAIKVVDMNMKKINISSDEITSYLNGEMIEGWSGKSVEDQFSKFLRDNTYSQAFSDLKKQFDMSTKTQVVEELQKLAKQQFGLDRLPKVTPHDYFSTKKMYFVPFDIHDLVSHNGAIAVYKDAVKTIARSFESSIKNISWGRIFVNASF